MLEESYCLPNSCGVRWWLLSSGDSQVRKVFRNDLLNYLSLKDVLRTLGIHSVLLGSSPPLKLCKHQGVACDHSGHGTGLRDDYLRKRGSVQQVDMRDVSCLWTDNGHFDPFTVDDGAFLAFAGLKVLSTFCSTRKKAASIPSIVETNATRFWESHSRLFVLVAIASGIILTPAGRSIQVLAQDNGKTLCVK